jgi:tetratricopeptide (TPR) repeat protein
LIDRAHTIFRSMEDWQGDARVMSIRSRNAYERGQYDEAFAQASEALQLTQAAGYHAGAMFALLTLGRIDYEGYGRFIDARVHLTRSLQIAQVLGDRYTAASIRAALGRNALSRGDFRDARAAFEEAFESFRRFRDRAYGGEVIQSMGRLAHCGGDNERARVLAQQALDAAGESGHFRTRRLALRLLGHALFALGEYIDAGVAYWDARELEQRIENPSLEVDTLAGLARVAHAQGKTDLAAEHVASILNTLAVRGAGGVEEPVRVYLTCHAVLRARRDPHADAVLVAGHALLMERAAQFVDEEERRMFVEELPAHRELLQEWSRLAPSAETHPFHGLRPAG